MMKKLFISIFIIFLAVFYFSCNSDPEVTDEPEEPQEEPQENVQVPKPETEYNQAKTLRDLISKYSLNNYAQSDYEEAENLFSDGENNYDKDNEASKSALYKAIAKYNVVIEMGFPLLIDEKKGEVDPVKEDSEALKANNASPDNYQKAIDTYNQALAEKEAGNYEKSIELMEEAKTLFDELYTEVVEKKDRAQAQLDALNQSIKNAEQQVIDDMENSQ
jgi:tetratricopeptide (TPR) repeat protein